MALVGLALLVGCSETAQGPGEGTATGLLEMTGGPHGSDARPTSGTVTFIGSAGHEVTTSASADGSFRATLTPGKYTVTGTSPNFDAGRRECVADAPIRVHAGEGISVNVICHRR